MSGRNGEPGRRGYYRARPPFSVVEGMGTPLFDQLSPDAVWLLCRFYSKFYGKNRSNLSVTYGEAMKAGVSNRRYARALWELLGFGFIKVVRPGRIERVCTICGLDDRWRSLNDLWVKGTHGPENLPPRWAHVRQTLRDMSQLQNEPGVPQKCRRLAVLRRALYPDIQELHMANINKRTCRAQVVDGHVVGPLRNCRAQVE